MILYRVRTAPWARTGKGAARGEKRSRKLASARGTKSTHERLLRFIVVARDGMWREVRNFAAIVSQFLGYVTLDQTLLAFRFLLRCPFDLRTEGQHSTDLPKQTMARRRIGIKFLSNRNTKR